MHSSLHLNTGRVWKTHSNQRVKVGGILLLVAKLTGPLSVAQLVTTGRTGVGCSVLVWIWSLDWTTMYLFNVKHSEVTVSGAGTKDTYLASFFCTAL